MSVARAVRELTDANLVVTPRYLEWLAKHGDEEYPPWIARKVMKLLKTPPRVRSGSFSGSSAGQCLRRQELAFLGKKPSIERKPSPQLTHIFNDGKWRHLRWQAALLNASIIKEIEVPIEWPDMLSKNTIDGVGYVWWKHPNLALRGKKFGLEIKGVNPFQYGRWISEPFPIEEHMHQIHRYMLVSDIDFFVVIYENKGTNEWKEWVVRPQKEYMEQSRKELEALNEAVRTKTLHDPLPSCQIRMGAAWTTCPYSGVDGVCMTTKRWE